MLRPGPGRRRHQGGPGAVVDRSVEEPILETATAAGGIVARSASDALPSRGSRRAPFVVDSSRITDKFGLRATPVEDALSETLVAYRSATS